MERPEPPPKLTQRLQLFDTIIHSRSIMTYAWMLSRHLHPSSMTSSFKDTPLIIVPIDPVGH